MRQSIHPSATSRAPATCRTPLPARSFEAACSPLRRAGIAVIGMLALFAPSAARAAVEARQDGDVLVVRGNAERDVVEIIGGETIGDVHVIATSDTLPFALLASHVRSVRVDVKGGDDTVIVRGLRIEGDLRVRTGHGSDRVLVTELVFGSSVREVSIGGRVDVRLGNQRNDVIAIDPTTPAGVAIRGDVAVSGADDVTLDGDGGTSRTEPGDLSIGGELRVSAKLACRIELDDVDVAGNTRIKTSSADDGIEISDTDLAGRVDIELGRGNDRLDLDFGLEPDNRFGAGFRADGGPGLDELDTSASNRFARSPHFSGFERHG